jgi:hypothetical protein
MPEVSPQAIAELVKPLFDYFLNRDKRRAAADSNKLRFWQDGMLRQLKAIADGAATEETYTRLKANLDETAGSVREAMERMRGARDKIGGGAISREIDAVLNSDGYGKQIIHWQISEILDGHNGRDMSQKAKSVCLQIEALNAALDRLHRLVYDD